MDQESESVAESSADLRARFVDDGFVRVDRLTSAAELEWIRLVYDGWLGKRVEEALEDPARRERLVSGNTLWVRLDRVECAVVERTTLVRTVRRLASLFLDINEASLNLGLRIFCKIPRIGLPVPWHQDEAHKDPAFNHSALNAWIPLDPATEASGCLRFIPRSHCGEVRLHRHPGPDVPSVSLVTDDVDESEAVIVPVPLGGASFHHCRTLHSSGPNTTEDFRRVLVAVVEGPPTRRTVPVDWPWLDRVAANNLDKTF